MKSDEKRMPRRPKDQKRIPLSMRITPDIREWLVRNAASQGRSITQEAELRLDEARRDENRAPLFHDAVYGRQTAGLLELVGRVIRNAVGTEDWLSDADACTAACAAMQEIAEAIRTLEGARAPDQAASRGRNLARGHLLNLRMTPPLDDHDSDQLRFGAVIGQKLGAATVRRARDHVHAASVDLPEQADA